MRGLYCRDCIPGFALLGVLTFRNAGKKIWDVERVKLSMQICVPVTRNTHNTHDFHDTHEFYDTMTHT